MTVFFKDRDDLMEIARDICSKNNVELEVVDRPIVSTQNDESVFMYARKMEINCNVNDLKSVTLEVINEIIENGRLKILYLYAIDAYTYLGNTVVIRHATE